MSYPASMISDSGELLYIYITLKKLECIQIKNTGDDKNTVPLETLFPKRFLLKQLNERLEDLNALADEICDDLFLQVSGYSRKTDPSAPNDLPPAIDIQNDGVRYPEFDEYFHFCLHQLHDFMIGLHWHQIDIEHLSKADSIYVSKNLEFVGYLLAFQRTLVDLVNKEEALSSSHSGATSPRSTRTTVPTNAEGNRPKVETKKSNLKSPGRRDSPQARRRVRFKGLKPNSEANDQRQHFEHDLADNHSVFALDLLIYAINIYIQRLTDTLVVWSASVQDDLNQVIDLIFESKIKVRSRQLQVIAKKIKVYNDVHLSVLDHLSDIKRTYLIKYIWGTLLSRDSTKLLWAYKNPRLKVYIQRIGLDVEIKILARLVKQCLQIFFNLIVCEINFDTIEVSTLQRNKDEKVRSQENIVNFISNWLRVDDVLFGYNRTVKFAANSAQDKEHLHADTLLKQTNKLPRLVAKTSTLSLNDKYASSSRILAQMDNLGEFMREFLHMISGRLRYEQQSRYFLEAILNGLAQFFDIVAPKLEHQLLEIKSKERLKGPQHSQFVASDARKGDKKPQIPSNYFNVDLLMVKIRCLKFIHVLNTADKIVANEAARMKVELDGDLELKLARFTQVCLDTKSKELE